MVDARLSHMERIVSERVHVGGLVTQLAQVHESFAVLTNYDTGLWWPTLEGGTIANAKEYVNGVLRSAKHDCLALGCPDWLDHSS